MKSKYILPFLSILILSGKLFAQSHCQNLFKEKPLPIGILLTIGPDITRIEDRLSKYDIEERPLLQRLVTQIDWGKTLTREPLRHSLSANKPHEMCAGVCGPISLVNGLGALWPSFHTKFQERYPFDHKAMALKFIRAINNDRANDRSGWDGVQESDIADFLERSKAESDFPLGIDVRFLKEDHSIADHIVGVDEFLLLTYFSTGARSRHMVLALATAKNRSGRGGSILVLDPNERILSEIHYTEHPKGRDQGPYRVTHHGENVLLDPAISISRGTGADTEGTYTPDQLQRLSEIYSK